MHGAVNKNGPAIRSIAINYWYNYRCTVNLPRIRIIRTAPFSELCNNCRSRRQEVKNLICLTRTPKDAKQSISILKMSCLVMGPERSNYRWNQFFISYKSPIKRPIYQLQIKLYTTSGMYMATASINVQEFHDLNCVIDIYECK